VVLLASALLSLSVLTGFSLSVVYLRRYFDRRIIEMEDAIAEEARKLSSGEPCKTAHLINQIGTLIGSQAGTSAKAALLADLSHAQRALNGAETEAKADGLQAQFPMLTPFLAGTSKSKQKGLFANPLFQLAVQAFTGGRADVRSNGGDAPGPMARRLGKG
jgi:hypothetical protein